MNRGFTGRDLAKNADNADNVENAVSVDDPED